MWVFIDDSGDGGFKFESGSTSHLVMAACVFRDPKQIELLQGLTAACAEKNHHRGEFKYNKTRDRVKDCYLNCIDPVKFAVRAIVIDKSEIYSSKLRGSPSALKSYAIRLLLTKNYGQIVDAKIVIDGHDQRGFGVPDRDYLTRMVNRESPGTIRTVEFADSKKNVGVQLADMVAGSIQRGYRTHKPSDERHMKIIRPRTYHPSGTLWLFK